MNGHAIGPIHRSPTRVQQIQRAASSGQAHYKFYLNPYRVLQFTLPSYGFTGGFHVVNIPQGSVGTPTPTPTPFTAANSFPSIRFIVQYQGASYFVTLQQPARQGPGGIWLVQQIEPK